MLFARARGLPRRRMLLAYALKNSLLPVITATGLTLGSLLTGAVITETVFALPGLGRLFVNAIGRQDIPVVQALVLLTGAAIIVINFLVDLAYGVVDPRVRLGRQ
jgi:peptide/nickel transport system permease protein